MRNVPAGWKSRAARAAAFIAFALVALAGPAAAETPASGPRPAIWLLADHDTKIYLFGTIHVLPPDLRWRSPGIDRVIEEADELVMEVGQSDVEETISAMLEHMQLGKEVPLESRISPERREPLRRMMASAGFGDGTLDGLQTWTAALLLGISASVESGSAEASSSKSEAVPLRGVEDVLAEEFERRRRPISGVETPEQHAGVFSGLSLSVQREMLEQTIDAYVAGQQLADPEELDWLSGDVVAVGLSMEQMPAELYDAVLSRRNRAWTDWLVERMARPGTLLFAVGAGHLAGRDSLQSMLESRGLTVARLD